MSEPVPQRIGDAERDQAASYLQEHLAQGRLTQEEFDDRVGAALAARTSADLTPLFTDLPAPRPDEAGQGPTTEQTWPTYRAAATTPVVREEPAPPAAPTPRPAVLAAVGAVVWPVWLIAMFATNWHIWWLVFVPIVVSGFIGKLYGDQREGRHRDRDRRRDRRELGD